MVEKEDKSVDGNGERCANNIAYPVKSSYRFLQVLTNYQV